MVSWNKEGFKVGHCYQAPLNQPYSLLALSNNTCIRTIMSRLRNRFIKIYKQKVFVHHYTEFMDITHFDHCLESCDSVIESYRDMEEKHMSAGTFQHYEDDDYTMVDSYRFKPLI